MDNFKDRCWKDDFEYLYKDLDDIKIYLHWYITRIALNSLIDDSKVTKHNIYINTTQEFKIALIDTSKKNNDNYLEHWKQINNL